MPIHDWKRAPVGLYHHFYQSWAVNLAEGLNDGVLPKCYFALIDQRAIGLVPAILTLARSRMAKKPREPEGGLAVATAPPKARVISQESDADVYAARANRVAIRDTDGELVSMIEIVSPGNKHSRQSMKEFIEKTTLMLDQGVNLLIIDLFPPTKRDPDGIHKVIWDQIHEEPFSLPAKKQFTLASYSASASRTAYVENVAVKDTLPAMPLFLFGKRYVHAPLEETYVTTWKRCPAEFREIVEKHAKP